MIDYHAHVAVLGTVRSAFGAGFTKSESLARDLAEALDVDPDAAALGACLDAILDHADSNGQELHLLDSAAGLWGRALAAYDDLALARKEFEQATLSPPTPASLPALQSSVDRLDALRPRVALIESELGALRQAIAPLAHILAHPRQQDQPSGKWGWRDVFLGRRTEAFVATLFEDADDIRSRAFAGGALAGYAGNAAGSAYLGAVVGGPRRSHRYRDRLARNTVGAWLRNATKGPGAADLARQLEFVDNHGKIAFPADLAKRLKKALKAAYPSRSAPDLDLGLGRVVRHLRLLGAFPRPAPPQPPVTFLSTASGTTVGGIDITLGDPGSPMVGIGVGSNPSPDRPQGADSQSRSGDACAGIALFVLTVGLALLGYCIGQWTTGHKCKPGDFFDQTQGSEEPDPRTPSHLGLSELKLVSDPEASHHILTEIFALQMTMWQAFDLAFAYLAVTGLIYPDELSMTSPLYRQFLSTPARNGWPHRPEANPAATYHLDPASPLEQPVTTTIYPILESPRLLLGPWPTDDVWGAAAIAMPLLERIAVGAGADNLDLDADRGLRHACWKTSPKTSIGDPVIAVEILPFSAE